MPKKTPKTPVEPDLRRRAEASMPPPNAAGADTLKTSAVDAKRLLHELQVHQIELEMQNAELQESRDRVEMLLEKYTDLYDFAPVGYLSLDENNRILEVNLTGAVLFGVERSRLIGQPLPRFVPRSDRLVLLEFLNLVFTGAGKQVGEVKFLKRDGTSFWADLHGATVPVPGPQKVCRVAFSDITAFKQAQEDQRRVEALTVSNAQLEAEIVRRQAVETTLRESELRQRQLLAKSGRQQGQLRRLSHRILQTREEERKRISRELHDDITQTLIGINIQLETLAMAAKANPQLLGREIARTQQLVTKSVSIVDDFARKLRPASLDDLGLTVTLKALLQDFMNQTGIRVQFTAFAGVDQLHNDRLTGLYRIVQAALANVVEHSHASQVKVSIAQIEDAVHLKISDNGTAFDVRRIENSRSRKHLGLVGMRERAEMLGGRFTVESEPGKGTTVLAQIPLAS